MRRLAKERIFWLVETTVGSLLRRWQTQLVSDYRSVLESVIMPREQLRTDRVIIHAE